jgi:glycosyltransferase involved in cell wall biosynthesis
MKIIVVAMAESVHTLRWLSQVADQGWEIHLFPSMDLGFARADFKNITVHHSVYGRTSKEIDKTQKVMGIPVYFTILSNMIRLFMRIVWPNYRAWQLKRLIKKLKPDIIHTLEMQQAGYLVDNVRKNWQGTFPKWIVTIWGSDIYYFGRFAEHAEKIKGILARCDYFSCECRRDVCLAKQIGLAGKAFPPDPVNGGFDLQKLKKSRQEGPTSKRKIIMLKGYQGWAGRAIYGLSALEKCVDLLKDYKIIVYSIADPGSPMPVAIDNFIKKTGLPVEVLPMNTPHSKLLELHGHARVSIGLSISDGISTSLLEAMVMGSFPIQSSTACADEWVVDGKTGILVLPEDVDGIERAIRKALTDDKLVDTAAIENAKTAGKRLDHQFLKEKAIQFYKDVYSEVRQ